MTSIGILTSPLALRNANSYLPESVRLLFSLK